MATYKETQITVVCEFHLNNECDRESCAAYKENSISISSTKELKNGRRYYTYACQRKEQDVKLLDIHFMMKNNPNFLFKNRKQKK